MMKLHILARLHLCMELLYRRLKELIPILILMVKVSTLQGLRVPLGPRQMRLQFLQPPPLALTSTKPDTIVQNHTVVNAALGLMTSTTQALTQAAALNINSIQEVVLHMLDTNTFTMVQVRLLQPKILTSRTYSRSAMQNIRAERELSPIPLLSRQVRAAISPHLVIQQPLLRVQQVHIVTAQSSLMRYQVRIGDLIYMI